MISSVKISFFIFGYFFILNKYLLNYLVTSKTEKLFLKVSFVLGVDLEVNGKVVLVPCTFSELITESIFPN